MVIPDILESSEGSFGHNEVVKKSKNLLLSWIILMNIMLTEILELRCWCRS